jgi:hypothetical protein
MNKIIIVISIKMNVTFIAGKFYKFSLNFFVILDACHMIKLVRNALREWLYFVNEDGKNICWQFFDDLVSLQEEKGLHLANKIRRRHINFQGEKMKVKLAVQTFSSGVADAFEYCCKDLQLQNFEDADETISFCRIFDKIFDLLNSRNSLTKNPYKKPISGYNINFIKQFFNQAKEYILTLKGPDGVKLIEGKRKTGFLGLIIDMSSVINFVEKYVIKEKCLIYLLTYKLSQDHIEMFFCAIRSKGGFNNNPTATQFEAAYKRLLTHAEITTSASANCLPQDDTQILYVSSNSPKIIFENNDMDSITFNDDPFENEGDDEIIMDTSNNYIADVVDYLCGFVVKKLKKKYLVKFVVQCWKMWNLILHFYGERIEGDL